MKFSVPQSGKSVTVAACIDANESILIDAGIALSRLPNKKTAIYSPFKDFIDRSGFWA
jgi:hypothetical protein